MKRLCVLALLVGAWVAGEARAALVFDNPGFDAGPYVAAARFLDDVTLSAVTGEAIRSMDFGFRSYATEDLDVDAVITFYGTVNTAATGTQSVTSGVLRSMRVPLGVIAAEETGTAGAFDLPGGDLSVPQSFAVDIAFYATGTNTPVNIAARLVTDDPAEGTSTWGFWADDNLSDGTFRGQEFVEGANLYLRLDNAVVPEPAALGFLALASLLCTRRRAR